MIFVDRFSKSPDPNVKIDNTLDKISEKVDSFENKKLSETTQKRPIVIFPEGLKISIQL